MSPYQRESPWRTSQSVARAVVARMAAALMPTISQAIAVGLPPDRRRQRAGKRMRCKRYGGLSRCGNAAQPSVSVRVSGRAAEGELAPLRAEEPMTVVIFGASGDLAKRKLLPALHQLQQGGYLPERYAVIGFSRTPLSDEAYREQMRAALT